MNACIHLLRNVRILHAASTLESAMPIIIFTTVTALVFCLGDAFMLTLIMRPLFEAALGNQMLDTLRLGPAALFYVIHIGGLVYFSGLPATRGGTTKAALINGAVLGFVAYSCYEMTSWTIMRAWNVHLVLVDVAWGTTLSGVSAWLGATWSKKSALQTARTP
jgi:uncharacterized membrane protein